ncbi:MAG: serine hydrolase [Bacteroidetes bacterium]|nr:serine hydrolase [Bacteroidota bacterium]
MSNLSHYKVSIFYLVLVALVSSAITYTVTRKVIRKAIASLPAPGPNESENCSFQIKRLNGDSLVKPILFVESNCESDNLQLLKVELNNLVSSYTADGTLSTASIYVRKFLTSEWICLNGSEMYNPGSMLKVPEMIAYLKMEEADPGLLNKVLRFEKGYNGDRQAVFVTESIKPGQSYSIRELLRYMIEYSDNNATFLLLQNIDVAIYKQVFSDFGLQVPDKNSKIYPMCVSDYSKFMRALFNASYLDRANSELAIELLSKSDFRNGILQGIPYNIRVAHKFGEEGNTINQELHESAIIYMGNSPYLLTIMTKGKDLKKQSKVIADISSKVYQALSANEAKLQ